MVHLTKVCEHEKLPGVSILIIIEPSNDAVDSKETDNERVPVENQVVICIK